MSKRKQGGFTLIELMVTIAILAIVVSVGYPMYTKQVLKAQRSDAKGGMMKLVLAQERYYAMHGSYATGANHADAVDLLNLGPDKLENGNDDNYDYDKATADVDLANFDFVISEDGDANTDDFLITATAIGPQAEDTDCITYTINQAGIKKAYDDAGVETDKCW